MQLVFWQEVLLIKDFITHLFHSSTVIGCYRFFHSILLFCSLHLFWNYGPPYCNCPSEGGGGGGGGWRTLKYIAILLLVQKCTLIHSFVLMWLGWSWLWSILC